MWHKLRGLLHIVPETTSAPLHVIRCSRFQGSRPVIALMSKCPDVIPRGGGGGGGGGYVCTPRRTDI